MKLFSTIFVAIIGVYLAKQIKIPAYAMVGPIISVMILNVSTDKAYFPSYVKVATQTITGAYIGTKIERKDLPGFKQLLLPIFVMMIGMICMTFTIGLSMHYIFKVPLVTALLASTPGGITDITLIGYDFDADVAIIALMHSLRIIFVLTIFPWWIETLTRNRKNTEPIEIASNNKKDYGYIGTKINQMIPNHPVYRMVFNILVAAIGAGIGVWFGFPSGALTFSMLFSAMINIFTERGNMPLKMRRLAQVGAGTLIGSGITKENLRILKHSPAPALLMLVGFLIFNYLISYTLNRLFKLEMRATLYSTSPAGASDMALIAEEFDNNINSPQIAIMQVARLICVTSVYPTLVRLTVSYLN